MSESQLFGRYEHFKNWGCWWDNCTSNLHFTDFTKFNLHKFMDNNEVITNAYANEISDRNDLPDYLCTLWPFMKWK
jgi:hypothetical protein